MDESPFDRIMSAAQSNNNWSAEQAQIQRNWQEDMLNKEMSFNSAEAALNRNWQKEMSDTAHQREILDLQKAGLNPVLSATGGNGASVGSGASASMGSVPSGAKGDTDESSTGAVASYLAQMLAAETSIRNTEVSAQAALAGSQLMAAASEYGSMLGFQSAENERTWKSEHPSNAYQMAGSLLSGSGVNINNVLSAAGEYANKAGSQFRESVNTKGFWNAAKDVYKGLIDKITSGRKKISVK